jgi:hypothetical protein
VAPTIPPSEPVSTLNSLPDPASIEKQKDGYTQMLNEQLNQGNSILQQQMKHQSDYITAEGEQKKKEYAMKIDQEVLQKNMALQQQHAQQSMNLAQQAAAQKAALEAQAMQLTMEYHQVEAKEMMDRKQYEMRKAQYELEKKLQEDMANLQRQANPQAGSLTAGHPPVENAAPGMPSEVPQHSQVVEQPTMQQPLQYAAAPTTTNGAPTTFPVQEAPLPISYTPPAQAAVPGAPRVVSSYAPNYPTAPATSPYMSSAPMRTAAPMQGYPAGSYPVRR